MLFLLYQIPLTYFIKRSAIHTVQQLVGFHQYSEAKAILDKIINETQIENNQLLILRAKCSLYLNLTDLCFKDIDHLFRSNLTSIEKKDVYEIRSTLHLRMGELDLAEKDAILSQSNSTIAKINYIKDLQKEFFLLSRNAQISESALILDKILEYSPLSENLILNRADISWDLRDYQNYIRYSYDFESKYPNISTVYFRKGIIHLCNSSFLDAIEYFNRSLSLPNCSIESQAAINLTNSIIKEIEKLERSFEKSDLDLISNTISTLNSSSFKYCSDNDRLVQTIYLYQIRLLRLNQNYDDAFEYLDKLILKYPKSPEFILERADLDLSLNNYDAAIELYSSLQKEGTLDFDFTQAKLEQANLLKRHSFMIDYYAFLGLKRNEGQKISIERIKDAYRKVARHWHPDCFSNPDKKKEAEKIMKCINTAYDILSNPQKKELYDRGLNPYHPKSDFPEELSKIITCPEFDTTNQKEGPLHLTIEL